MAKKTYVVKRGQTVRYGTSVRDVKRAGETIELDDDVAAAAKHALEAVETESGSSPAKGAGGKAK